MAGILQPKGVSWVVSLGTASTASPTIVEYPWNPSFSGWTGDLSVAYLGGGSGSSSSPGFAYPGPVVTGAAQAGFPGNTPYPMILGVIVGFKYTPANATMAPSDYPYFAANTALAPGSTVTVKVVSDAQGVWAVQFSGTPGAAQSNLFSGGNLTASNFITTTVGVNTYNFAVGNNNTGFSGAYINYNSLIGTFTTPGTATFKDTYASLQIVGLNKAPGNSWYTANPLNNAPNNILNVTLNNLAQTINSQLSTLS